MATSIENESGELLWSPNNFGSYSVEKIQLIVDILKSLLQDTTLKLDTTSSLSGDYYTKEQTNETFLLKTDFNSLATDLVTSKLNEYIQQKETSGDLVDAETVRTCVKILNWVCKVCFDQSYTDTSEITEMTEITPFPTSIQNITSNLASMSTSVSHLQSVVYEVNSDGTVSSIVRVTTKSEFTALTDRIGSDTLTTTAKTITGAINELNSNVATGSRVTDLETKTDNLSSTVTNLNSSISTLNSTVSSLSTAVSSKVNTSSIVTKSTDSTTSVPAASLEYEDRDNINSLQNSLNSLISRVTTKSEFTALTDRIGSDTLTTSAKTITGAINELNSNVATGSRVTDLETKTDNLSSTVTNLNSSISTLNSTVSSLSTAVSNKVNTSNIVTKSTDSTTSVPAASLEYEDRDNIKSLQNSLNSLINRVTALEAKVNA